MEENKLDKSYGVKFDFEVKTDTRPFAQVDAAADKAKIKHEHKPEKPSMSQAIARAINFLMRVCAASIAFPTWSKYASWEVEHDVTRTIKGAVVKVGTRMETLTGRNPNFSLKITQVKQAKTDASTTWRINIANRNMTGENMGHVLNVTYSPDMGLFFTPGTDVQAHSEFGQELQEIVQAEYQRFLTNYNDEDIRKVLDAELADMRALKIIKKNNTFIPRDYVDHAKALYIFAKECGQVVSWLGLDSSEMTRDSLLADLKTSILADFAEYEEELDAKLNTPTGERKRGEKQRERMFDTAMGNIDNIMAMADYHAAVLGVMADGIRERRDALRNKAHELLTRDFDTPAAQAQAPVAQVPAQMGVVNPDEVF